ncbi:MAG: aminoglycoside phosphotransferase family protein [Oscillospiraceae bacterium]|nr:aminoglycoside phosphotransferase family protein [Oscillospiraceae bacterium]
MTQKQLNEILDQFEIPASITPYGNGHINDTFCIECSNPGNPPIRFIIQRLSRAAFPHPEELMANFAGITSFLQKKIAANGGDPMRESLSLIPTKEGKDFFTDSNYGVWRLTPFIEGTECYQSATPELFEASAYAFGRFQYMLQDYPAETLFETIVKFHDTEDRYAKFEAALAADKMGRAAEVADEIAFVRARKEDCSVALQALRDGKLPLRVTHNDTKLNNVLIDAATQKGLCVVDLDTTMPGLSINDFGDSIRFGANHSAEDEKDLSKVNFDIELYRIYTRGFLEGAQGGLTDAELEYLPWGAKLMTLECGIRFLTDYLDGDNYFHIRYPEQNLDRCRTQFKLVSDMEAQWEQMHAIVREIAK